MNVKVHYPEKIEIVLTSEGELYSLDMKIHFESEDKAKEAYSNVVDFLIVSSIMKIEREDKVIKVSTKMFKPFIMNLLAGYFIAYSPLLDVTFREMFFSIMKTLKESKIKLDFNSIKLNE